MITDQSTPIPPLIRAARPLLAVLIAAATERRCVVPEPVLGFPVDTPAPRCPALPGHDVHRIQIATFHPSATVALEVAAAGRGAGASRVPSPMPRLLIAQAATMDADGP